MTSIIGIRSKDGVVIGADSSATFEDSNQLRTIQQPTKHKIRIIGDQIILAGTGAIGYGQRFYGVINALFKDKNFQKKPTLEIAKMLSATAVNDFRQTGINSPQYSALVAYKGSDGLALCEFAGGQQMFQPELKQLDDLWFVSAGSGQTITDPFLALLRRLFWKDEAPNLQDAKFAILWALDHACEVSAGGIKEPIKIAVLEPNKKGHYRARFLDDAELAEHRNIIDDATKYFGKYKDIMGGAGSSAEVPRPKK